MLDASARQRIIAVARRLCGVPYDDSHYDDSWKNLDEPPTKLDCSRFVCRVAREALGPSAETFPDDAGELIRRLVVVNEPQAGDIVGYWREATAEDNLGDYHWDSHWGLGSDLTSSNLKDVDGQPVWHVMIFIGNSTVIGTSKLDGKVVVRPLHYNDGGQQRWDLVNASTDSPTPYRRLELRPDR